MLMGTLLRRPLLAAVVLIFCWMPANLVLHTLSIEEFSPIGLNQALPTLLRTPWRTVAEEETSRASQEDLEALAKQAATFMSILSGQQPQPAARREGFYDRGDYEDFSLLRVVLGYSVPTLAAVALAASCFYRGDL